MLRTRLAALAAIPLLVAACGGSSSTTSSTSSGSAGATTAAAASSTAHTAAELTVSSTKFGKALTDAKGSTLYLFQPDTTSKSTCYGSCATYWPPLITHGAPLATGGLDKSKLGTTTRSDGSLQVTYDGHPLYYYVGDKSRGAVTGQDVNANGGLWFLVRPNGTADMAA
jgi:predicted lipoprotein with Yx(FWY)xxD motif